MNRTTNSWRRVLGAVLTVALLAPVPVFAFTTFKWVTLSTGTEDPFGTPTLIPNPPTTGNAATLILPLLSTPPTFTSNEIWKITGTFKADSTGQIGGTWANLNAFNNIRGFFGNVNVNVYVVNGATTNNMFGGTGQTAPFGGTNYNALNSAPSSAGLTPATGLANGTSYTITVAFTINAGTKYTVPSSPNTVTLNLN